MNEASVAKKPLLHEFLIGSVEESVAIIVELKGPGTLSTSTKSVIMQNRMRIELYVLALRGGDMKTEHMRDVAARLEMFEGIHLISKTFTIASVVQELRTDADRLEAEAAKQLDSATAAGASEGLMA